MSVFKVVRCGRLEVHGDGQVPTIAATIDHSAGFPVKIDRNLWDISAPGMKDDLIKAEVALSLDLHFVRA